MNISVGVAGSTYYTSQCAAALASDPRFEIAWVLTSGPRPVGRHQELAPNLLHDWPTPAKN